MFQVFISIGSKVTRVMFGDGGEGLLVQPVLIGCYYNIHCISLNSAMSRSKIILV